jgi:hypothetical protein
MKEKMEESMNDDEPNGEFVQFIFFGLILFSCYCY